MVLWTRRTQIFGAAPACQWHMREMAPCGSFSELHSVARRPTFCGGVSGAKLSRSAISSRMALLPRLMVSLTVCWLWLLLALEDACTQRRQINQDT